jgi:hypothetical protein
VAVGAAVGIGPIAFGALSGATPKVVAIVSGLLIFASGLFIAYGKERGGKLITAVVTIIGVIGAIYTVVDVVGRGGK